MWTVLPQMEAGYVASVDDKWVTLRPSAPGKVRSERVDRDQWRSVIRSGSATADPTLEQYAAYAALTDSDSLVMLSMVPALVTGQKINIETMQRGDGIDVFRTYGRLSPGQQALARNGGFEQLTASLTPKQSKPARKIVFGRYASLTEDRKGDQWGPVNNYGPNNPSTDPLRRLGAGVPQGSKMRVIVLEKTLIYARPQLNGQSPNGMTAEDIGNRKAWTEHRPSEYDPDYGFLAFGKAEQIVVEFEFPGIGFLSKRAQLDRVGRDTVYMRLEELPEDVQKQITESYKKAVERFKGGGG
jgi:hypothetical protein